MSIAKKIKGSKRSKTVWFNSVVATLALMLPQLVAVMPTLKEYMTIQVYGIAFIVVSIVNILIRAITNESLEDKS